MLTTLILGILAGAGAPYVEEQVKALLEGVAAGAPIPGPELRLFSFALLLVGAALLAWLFGNGSGVALAFGAALGVFAPRIITRIQARRAPDYSEDDA